MDPEKLKKWVESKGKGPPREDTPAARGCGALFFLVFAVMGTAFTGVMIWTFYRSAEPLAWARTPCTVLDSEVRETDDDESPYEFAVSYRYEAGGRERTGKQYSRDGGTDDDYAPLWALRRRYRPDVRAECFVAPEDPTDAVLDRSISWMPLLFLPIPLIFIAVGVFGIRHAWRAGKKGKAPISEGASLQGKGPVVGIFVTSIFLVIGLAVTAAWVAPTAFRVWRAQSWDSVQCKVLSGHVRAHSSDDGTTYSIDILY